MSTIIRLSSSRAVSAAVLLAPMSEPLCHHANGIYLGNTRIYNMPFLLDFNRAINPHISVIGMTGSGKTYLLRSIIVKSAALLGYGVLVLDWNGEYSEAISFLNGSRFEILNNELNIAEIESDGLMGRRISIDLSGAPNEQKKIDIACLLLNSFIYEMHRKGESEATKQIIVLDEAWKIMSSGNVSQLYREARKFGIGVITATQLVSDANNEVIANSGTVFVFRIQSHKDQRILLGSSLIGNDSISKLSEMNVGECFVRSALKNEGDRPFEFFIRKIQGFDISSCAILVGKMMIDVPLRKFEEITRSLRVEERTKLEILAVVRNSHLRIDASSLIEILARSKAERSEMVYYLRLLGLDDKSIVFTCATVLESLDNS